jgi:hypothetical protein
MKELTLRVPASMVPLIEEWVKHIPEIELASLEESGVYEIDEINRRMALALKILKENRAIRYSYDYTWIMVAIGDGVVNGLSGFRSPKSFIEYLINLGVKSVPSRSTVSTWFGRVIGKYPDWEFTDTKDPNEIMRRKNIVRQLLSALNKAANIET